MERRAELNTKARDLERRGALDAALQIYLGLVGDSTMAAPGSLWVQIGSLQQRLGQNSPAEESYSQAVTSFTEAGQFNNALAVCFILQDMNPDSLGAQLNVADLALTQGYRTFARSAVAAYARQMTDAHRAVDAAGPVAAFLNRYTDEKSLWQDWVAEIVEGGREVEAIEVLESLETLLAGAGNSIEGSRVGLELLRLHPSRRPAAESEPHAWETPVQPEPASGDAGTVAPLVEHDGNVEVHDPESAVAPLAGLELTDIGSDSDWEPAGDGGMPLLDTWGDEPESAAESAIGDPVPLLGSWDDEVVDDAVPTSDEPVSLLDGWGDEVVDDAVPTSDEPVALLDGWGDEAVGDVPPTSDESVPSLDDSNDEAVGDAAPTSDEPVPLLDSWNGEAVGDVTPWSDAQVPSLEGWDEESASDAVAASGEPAPLPDSWDEESVSDADSASDEPVALLDGRDDQATLADAGALDELEEETEAMEPLVFLTSFEAKSTVELQPVDLEFAESPEASDFAAEEIPEAATPAETALAGEGDSAAAGETMDVDGMVAELQRLTTKEVDDVDSDTHFDLGVAFKEMGLWEESLANLARAMSEGHDPIAILEVVGEILVGRGEDDLARRLLGSVPGAGTTASPEFAGIHYWLGRVAERDGTPEEARQLFHLVVDVHPDFMDAEQRLLRLAPRAF